MSTVIPQAFAFHFCLPVRRLDAFPTNRKGQLTLSEEFALPWPDGSLFNGKAQFSAPDLNRPPSLQLRMAWNPQGIAVAVELHGKTQAIKADTTQPTSSDGLQLWLDTRNTQTIHRASRFCHHFCLLAADGRESSSTPLVMQLPIARASEDAKLHPASAFQIEQTTHTDGYTLGVWLPATTLTGYDIEVCSQLGFMCLLVDRELGLIPFTVGIEFPISNDPSLWQTLDLVST